MNLKRRRLTGAVLALVLLLALVGQWGCGRSEQLGSAGEMAAALGQASGQKADASALIGEILPRVEEIRGLQAKDAVRSTVANREELRQLLEQESAAAGSLEIEQAQRSLLRLGLIEPGADLEQELLDLVAEDTAGFYDQETGELKIIISDSGLGPGEEITVAHELSHALQDQHYPLLKLIATDEAANDDVYLARLSLIEGDASLVEQEYFYRYMDERSRRDVIRQSEELPLPEASPYLLDSFAFPYEAGTDFASYLREKDGWQGINAAFERPPESTEQILHPEKYLAGDRPVAVELPTLPQLEGAGWQRADENVLGEFDILEMLAYIEPEAAERGAAGWGGSAYQLFVDGDGREVLLLLTAWDSVADAEEFRAAFNENLFKREGVTAVRTSAALNQLVVRDGAWSVEQRQAYVAITFAPTAEMAKALSQGLLTGSRV